MLHERGLDLGRRHPLPGDFEHVVGAAFVRVVAVRVEVVLVAGDVPLAFERGLRLLVLVPVVGGARVARDPEVAGRAWPEVVPVVVHDLRAIAGDRGPARARARAAGDVRDEDVQHLRGPDPVEDLQAESLPPRLEQRLGQRLAGGDAHPERGEVVSEVLLGIREQGRIERWRGEEDGRPLRRDEAVHEVGRRALGLVDGRRADAEREEDAVAETVRVEQGRDGEVAIAFGRREHRRAVRLAAIDHVVLQVHGALREAGRARRVQPEARVVRRRVRGRELVRRRGQEALQRQRLRRCVASGHDDVTQPGQVFADLEHLREERRGDDDRDGAAVGEDVAQVVRHEQRVRRHRHGADLDRAEEGVDERGRVEAHDDDALFHPDPELAEGVAGTVDVGGNLAVRHSGPLAADGDGRVAHAAMCVNERLGGVVPVRQLGETDRGGHCAGRAYEVGCFLGRACGPRPDRQPCVTTKPLQRLSRGAQSGRRSLSGGVTRRVGTPRSRNSRRDV